jgi:hypothetical protein
VSGEGDMGTGERIRAIPAGADVMGLGVGIGDEGMRSACGTGRRRLRMEEAGSVTTRCLGTVADGSGGGLGGEGGGECWYVVVLLYVVHEKRLAGGSLSFSGISPDCLLSELVYGGVVVRKAGCSVVSVGWSTTVTGDPFCWLRFVGVIGLGYANVVIPRPWFADEVGEVKPLRPEVFSILSGTIGLMKSLCVAKSCVSVVTG